MRHITSIFLAITLGAVGMWYFGQKPQKVLPPPQPPLIVLEKMGHLVSVKVNYANVIEFSKNTTQDIPWTDWELRFGGTKVLLVARGDCLIGTDIRLAKYENTDNSTRTTTIVLPSPKPMHARVNHDSSERGGSFFYTMDSTGIAPLVLDSSNRTKAIDGALNKAQLDIEKACRTPDILNTARKNTESALTPAFTALGWNIKFHWK